MSALDRVGLLGRGKRRVVEVKLPGGDSAYLRSWTERERTGLEVRINSDKGSGLAMNFRRRVLVVSLCDAEGNRLFQDNEEDAIGEMDAADASLLFDRAWELAGFNGVEVSELEKNSNAAPAAS